MAKTVTSVKIEEDLWKKAKIVAITQDRQLSEILDEALKNPDNVVKLSLRKKKYRSFPDEVLKLKNLQYLDLSKNSIKELSDSIVTLKSLQFLIVSKTGLERLPVNIGRMKNLKYLNINQNNVTTLPYSFGNLESLEFLDMWSNSLDYLPENIDKLKKLRWLDYAIFLSQKLFRTASRQLFQRPKYTSRRPATAVDRAFQLFFPKGCLWQTY